MAGHITPTFIDLSYELLCHILQYLPLKELLSMAMLCKKLTTVVDMHLNLRKHLDFCEGTMYGYMPSAITDEHMHCLFKKCPQLEAVYGLHPLKVERRRLRKRSALTVPGIIEALSLCCCLNAVETSDLKLFEAIMQNLPRIQIIGHFRNRDGVFPPHASQRLKLQPYPRISSLHLIGVEVPELTAMPHLEHLHLQCVRFTKLQPFRAFLALKLKTFVMKHCMGPTLALRYLSLIIALSSSPLLSRLELVRVPLPGGLFQRAVEDSYRLNGFVNLKTLVISGCKGVMEADVGHLMIVSSKNLESVCIQPSLTRDSLFVSLHFAQCEFSRLKNIHLGFIDKLNSPEEWSNEVLLSVGLAEMPDTPSCLTDSGMKVISQLFPNIKSMSVSNCPHLMAMDQWSQPTEGQQAWKELTDLTLERCHCLLLASFALFLAFLPKIEVVILNDMFREPPKGCSHVGLSAGTGLGMSSAVVSNQEEHIAVQGHVHEFEMVPDELAMENEVAGREGGDEGNADRHVLVVPQGFFDEEMVPPPERHQEDIVPGEIAQNEPENRIRRELNDDYNVALNIEIMQVSDMENSNPAAEGEAGKKEVAQVSDAEEKPKIDRQELKNEKDTSHKQEISSSKELYCTENVLTSDEEGNLVIDETVEKQFDKKVKTSEIACSHFHECKKQCAKGFDPNQPSTSKGGNCMDCGCSTDSISEPPKESSADYSVHNCSQKYSTSNLPPIKRKAPQNDVLENNSFKRARTLTDGDLVKDLSNKKEDDIEDEAQRGPLTRRRKQVLDRDIAAEHQTSDQPNSYKRRHSKTRSYNAASRESRASEGSKLQSTEHKNSCKSREDHPKDKSHRRHRHGLLKRKKGDKLYTRHYPFTRSQRSKLLNERYVVNQGSQATSADIRRSLRKQKGSSKRCRRRSCRSSHRHSHSHISARQQIRKHVESKTNREFHNKGTSTSDPLMEDDAVLTLRLVSETLISLTVISCGISDLVIDHCQSLAHVEVQACRILKMLQLHYSPSLKRLNVSQCPKLSMEAFIPEVVSLVASRKILVSFEPCMQSYSPVKSEKLVFSKTPLEQSIILFHDFTDSANESFQASAKESLFRWMEIVQKIYCNYSFSSLLSKHRKKKLHSRESRARYPYGHNLRRIHGVFHLPADNETGCIQWRYEILTNDLIFASIVEMVPWDYGFPAPETSTAYSESDAICSVIENEFTEKKLKLRKKIMAFYIPVCKNNLQAE